MLCIVGAGTSGLAVAQKALENHISPVIFEQSNDISGTWKYMADVADIKSHNEIHSSMYKHLRTNLPKEIMSFPNFSILKAEESYVTSQTIFNFLNEYAIHFDIMKYIKFLHSILRIIPRQNKWQVIVKNLKTNVVKQYYFDYVVICSGHYHSPIYPKFKNSSSYEGVKIHSHDFRSSKQCLGKCVLIVGAGPSGMDLCCKVSRVAMHVVLSHNNPEVFDSKFPKNVTIAPGIAKFCKNGVCFVNGTFEYIDYVIYCTGYKYVFPFISTDCNIFIHNNYIKYLYKHCININHPKMSFVGIPFYVCFAQMVDLQSRFLLQVAFRNELLPSSKVMQMQVREQTKYNLKHFYKKDKAHMLGPSQNLYYKDLSNAANIKPIPSVFTHIHNESSKDFVQDINNFRNDDFKIIDEVCFIKTSK